MTQRTRIIINMGEGIPYSRSLIYIFVIFVYFGKTKLDNRTPRTIEGLERHTTHKRKGLPDR